MLVIVPNALIDREMFYTELLAYFNEYGVIPEFTIQPPTPIKA